MGRVVSASPLKIQANIKEEIKKRLDLQEVFTELDIFNLLSERYNIDFMSVRQSIFFIIEDILGFRSKDDRGFLRTVVEKIKNSGDSKDTEFVYLYHPKSFIVDTSDLYKRYRDGEKELLSVTADGGAHLEWDYCHSHLGLNSGQTLHTIDEKGRFGLLPEHEVGDFATHNCCKITEKGATVKLSNTSKLWLLDHNIDAIIPVNIRDLGIRIS